MDVATKMNMKFLKINIYIGAYRLQKSKHTIIFIFADSGPKPKIATADVSLLVQDTNDNAPEFEHSPYTVHVVEELKLEEPIFVVQARDRDTSAIFNEIEYSIRAGGLHDEIFQVNESSGEIYVKTKLDREQTEKMTLEILAVDSGSPRLTGK